MYASTTCPGDYLLSKMDYIVKEANKINKGSTGKLNLIRVLEKGSTGTAVENLQKALNKDLGIKLRIDGIFGDATYKALLQYQKKHGLKADGIVGKNTAHKLNWLWQGK
jgi:peptidoglycan hydrolase-like protein with peptidoglycan-binding domain